MKQTPTLRSERELTCHSVAVVTPGTDGQRAIWCRVAWPPSMASQTDRHYGRPDVLDTEPCRRWLNYVASSFSIISVRGRCLFLLSSLHQHRRAAGDQAQNGRATNMASETDRHCGRSDHSAELYEWMIRPHASHSLDFRYSARVA